MSKTETFTFGRLEVVLDAGEVFPDDPGMGTPAMVYLYDKKTNARMRRSLCLCSTYWWAVGEQNIDGVDLNKREIKWLDSLDEKITKFIDDASKYNNEISH